ncbi:TonB-dependent hemoglobin/transferrin/lactoferrin family receptor [Luteimonas gilva]|uniref:TonB-dependent hemoglobin/transferrin/lactoferrin family receptor n=1 Tax=Luteimonas gilva TaxID=2572684 RepID=A0A4U5JML3_9GAMM|nr:TonB-dependent hemoglobin/transferrin/lactoferrin family receptor [Luteimonas gilva]TKR30814.1 TonB-dependent hemoglobin/transferrin/lactoferrin family receptor [Luteimonas gilva]
MRPSLLSFALWLALPGLAAAQTAPSGPADGGDKAIDLDPVVVTATRTARPLSNVPNTVDVIGRERMDDTLVRDLRDLVRYEPGVSVTSGIGRFGLGDIRIRGLGGNRVRIQTDGIAVSDAFAIGSFSNANRNFVDMDTLKRVEIVRGPTSSLYGSDALGGVVSFVTKDPSDYLDGGKDAYFGFKLSAEGDWSGLSAGATAAFGSDRWSGLVTVNHRQGQETKNMGERGVDGAARTTPNPQERNGRSVLSKLVYALSPSQRFKLTVEGDEDAAETDMRSSLGFQPLTRATNSAVGGDDRQTRARVSLAHEMDDVGTGFADRFDWQVYRQDSETNQDTFEVRRTAAGVDERRDRSFDFDQRQYGVQANFFKSFDTGAVKHDLAYGLDVARTETKQKRDGLVTNLVTGRTSKTMLPDVFPARDFPNSRTTNAALYLQDEMSFAGGDFRLVPGVRVDRYELRPDVDNIFAEDNPGVAVTDLSKTNVSPKLGAVWHFAPQWSLFGGYSRGFRAPPYHDVNIGFTNLMFGYTAIANPDLKPETSDGFEAGVRFVGDAAYASLSGYHNRYRDFIESFRFVGVNAGGLQVFQSQNIADAKIYGAELKAGVDLGRLSARMGGWSLRGAAAWSRGRDETHDTPLQSVDPLTASLGVAYDRDSWGAELAGRFAQRKKDLDELGLYATPGYGVLDLLAHWNFAPGAKLNVGVFNLADRKYWEGGDLPDGIALASLGALDRYTSPGRSLSVSVAVNW